MSTTLPDPSPLPEDPVLKEHAKAILSAVGVKHDAGKSDLTAIAYHPNALAKLAAVLDYGAKKYARNNWSKVPNLESRYLAACIRHVFARARGEKLDPESGLPHLAHAMCCLAFILELGD